jgi:hypothetical protein
MALTVIEPTPGLPPAQRRRAHRAGPSSVAVRTSYPSLLATAGFVGAEHFDVTAEYRVTQAAWMDALRKRSKAIRAEIGDEAYDERLATGRGALAAIDDGVLSRRTYRATRP